VNEPSNHPPVANAGPDQTIILPNTIILDGIGSTDPDNNIADYLWTKIAGPASFNIVNANSLQSQVTNLVEGIYQFELKVTDAEGLFSLDTIVVSVSRIGIATCDISNRPLIKAQLIPYATIPSLYGREANHYKAVAAGNKLIFQSQAFEGVGLPAGYNPYYIFDKPSLSWTLADLSVRRFLPGMAVVGNKVYFAGGGLNDGENIDTLFSTIDIYDAVTNNWTVSSLSRAGYCQDGVTLGDRIFFPSGDVVQIFNTATNTCTTSNLSVPRFSLTPVVAGDKVYFAGGYISSSGIVSDRVDVYDNSISHWTTFSMREPKASFAGIYTNNTIFWVGGVSGIYPSNFTSAKVQAYNVINRNSTEACLFAPREGLKVVLKNNKIVSFIGSEDAPQNKFDIYDIATNSWSIGILPFTIQLSTIFSDGDSIYVAGGVVNRSWTNQIWKLDF